MVTNCIISILTIYHRNITFTTSTKETGRLLTNTKILSLVDRVAGNPAAPGSGSIASICSCHCKTVHR